MIKLRNLREGTFPGPYSSNWFSYKNEAKDQTHRRQGDLKAEAVIA